jgi:hypothetical protein
MGEYEPDDSRDITQKKSNIPIEPERTGPREPETRGPVNRSDPETGKAGKRADDHPKGKGPSRSNEQEASVSSKHRTW